MNLKRHLFDQDITIWWNNWHFIKTNIVFSLNCFSNVNIIDIIFSLDYIFSNNLSAYKFPLIEIS